MTLQEALVAARAIEVVGAFQLHVPFGDFYGVAQHFPNGLSFYIDVLERDETDPDVDYEMSKKGYHLMIQNLFDRRWRSRYDTLEQLQNVLHSEHQVPLDDGWQPTPLLHSYIQWR